MTTVILAEKPNQALAYASAFSESKRGKGLSLKRLRRVTIQRFISMWNQQMVKFW